MSLAASHGAWARSARCIGIAVLVGSMPACAGAGASRLQGHWRGTRADGVSGDVSAAANAFAASLSIDVTGDSMVVVQGAHRQVGRYRVLEEDGAKLVLSTDTDGPLDPQTFVFVDPDTMRWDVLAGKEIVFTR